MSGKKIVYFDHENEMLNPLPPFMSGDAGLVWLDESGTARSDSRVQISPNSLHALHGHGVVGELNGLDFMFSEVGHGTDAVVAPAAVEAATRIFYEADRMTYGATHDLHIRDHEGVEYRLVVDNREYQRTLSQLQFLASSAAQRGLSLRIRI